MHGQGDRKCSITNSHMVLCITKLQLLNECRDDQEGKRHQSLASRGLWCMYMADPQTSCEPTSRAFTGFTQQLEANVTPAKQKLYCNAAWHLCILQGCYCQCRHTSKNSIAVVQVWQHEKLRTATNLALTQWKWQAMAK